MNRKISMLKSVRTRTADAKRRKKDDEKEDNGALLNSNAYLPKKMTFNRNDVIMRMVQKDNNCNNNTHHTSSQCMSDDDQNSCMSSPIREMSPDTEKLFNILSDDLLEELGDKPNNDQHCDEVFHENIHNESGSECTEVQQFENTQGRRKTYIEETDEEELDSSSQPLFVNEVLNDREISFIEVDKKETEVNKLMTNVNQMTSSEFFQIPALEDNNGDASPTLLSNISTIPPPSYSPLTPLMMKNMQTRISSIVEEPSPQSLQGIDTDIPIYDSDDSVRDPDFVAHDTINSNSDTDCEKGLTVTTKVLVHSEDRAPEQRQSPERLDVQDIMEEVVTDESKDIMEEVVTDDIVYNSERESVNEYKGRKKRGRKLKQKYNRQENKNRKYNNLPYETKQKEVKPKKFIDFKCPCKKNCADLIPREDREREFYKFRHLGSYAAQVLYIKSKVTETKKKRSFVTTCSPSKSKPRIFTRSYTLNNTPVCREMFCGTLQITPQKITISLRKDRVDKEIKDRRGEHVGGWNKTPQSHIDLITDVINRLPKYQSHYRREKNSDVLYLQPGMTVPKIYELFKIEFEKQFGKDAKYPSYGVLRKVFVQKFNLRCKSLKKDTCNKCDIYEMALKNSATSTEREDAQRQKEEHQKIAKDLRKKMKEDFQQAKACEEIECLTYDLEKTLPLPRIPTGIVFYKRQLWVYNCGIHSASDDVGNCYVWAEGEAGRGAQEVGSCLRKYIKCVLPATVKNLILWSDCCGGQNRNIKIVLILKAVLNNHPSLETISFRYLESGHTFLPNDNDFAKIETRLKQHERIYSVDDYTTIMKQCKRKNPLKVYKMESSDFIGSKILEKKIVNRKIFNDKTKVNWLKTKEIKIEKKYVDSLFMRTSFDEDYKELIIKKKNFKVKEEDLNELWPSGKPINKEKLNDLQSLFHLIPEDCIEYYKKLKGSNAIIDDIDCFGGEPDFNFEED